MSSSSLLEELTATKLVCGQVFLVIPEPQLWGHPTLLCGVVSARASSNSWHTWTRALSATVEAGIGATLSKVVEQPKTRNVTSCKQQPWDLFIDLRHKSIASKEPASECSNHLPINIILRHNAWFDISNYDCRLCTPAVIDDLLLTPNQVGTLTTPWLFIPSPTGWEPPKRSSQVGSRINVFENLAFAHPSIARERCPLAKPP